LVSPILAERTAIEKQIPSVWVIPPGRDYCF
jgi:hypothetical protein